jgi:hypothetical protein
MARIYVKKQLFVEHLTFSERQMLKLANVAVAEVKDRLSKNRDGNDRPAKPLSKWYARIKAAKGLNPWRDYKKYGSLLKNLLVRTVTKNRMRAENSTRRDRLKARELSKIQPWIVYSPTNQRKIRAAAGKILFEKPPASLVREITLGLGRSSKL